MDENEPARPRSLTDALRDPSRPLPPAVWVTLAALVCAGLFLALRLMVLRGARSDTPAASDPPAAATATAGATTRRSQAAPPSSPQAFRALVEGWRLAWQNKNLDAYLSYYARSFGSQGKDLEAWARHKRGVFAGKQPIEIEIRDLKTTVCDAIAIVSFTQIYRSGAYLDRGEKKLYLLPEDGAWKIFNEEWMELK